MFLVSYNKTRNLHIKYGRLSFMFRELAAFIREQTQYFNLMKPVAPAYRVIKYVIIIIIIMFI